MRRALLTLTLLLAGPGLAQNTSTKIGFIDVDKVKAQHPSYKVISQLEKEAAKALDPLRKKIVSLQNTVGTKKPTSAQEKQYKDLQTQYNTTADKYQKQLKPKLDAMAKSIDAAIKKVAVAQGFKIVMNKAVAASSGMVVYADEKSTDLTAAVIKALK
ncbi:OmpH family outer membrane protein [Deinococcus cellulosilyticus]|uniref:Outer membrane chaperone Skp (OmpH) n=1 Tax=Deinococcus cellulosilyticus (strain DSM 18568 / NBRC 106333 / KACC 11606 / 5516J-15) TaxID=1223518 RepID=A0A511N9E8_DEIC1|nr:OmpH family outer membrane protein [Deinococcus cellulosilyticus]GEM49001.1 hypothetical protein DC3_46360 [Deinococcus cellulosilyticus NBRC 106333 = KACC 11606]